MGNKAYINSSQVSFSNNDFIIECGIKKNRLSDETIKPEDVDFELYMSPQYAKALAGALSKAVSVFEEVYGTIKTEGNLEALKKYTDGKASD